MEIKEVGICCRCGEIRELFPIVLMMSQRGVYCKECIKELEKINGYSIEQKVHNPIKG